MLVTWDTDEYNLFLLCVQNMQIRVPYRPIDSKICALSADRDKLPSGKQILALTLTWVLYLLCRVCGSFRRSFLINLILQLQGQIGRWSSSKTSHTIAKRPDI